MEENNEVKKEEVKVEGASTELKSGKGFGIAALVLGLIAFVMFCVVYISIPCAILAIIFGIIGIKREGKGMAIAGLVLGIISVVLYALMIFGIFSFFNAVSNLDVETINSIALDLEDALRTELNLD